MPKQPAGAPPAALLGGPSAGQGDVTAMMAGAMNMLFQAMLQTHQQHQQQQQQPQPQVRRKSAVVGGGQPRGSTGTDLVLWTGTGSREVCAQEAAWQEPDGNGWDHTQRGGQRGWQSSWEASWQESDDNGWGHTQRGAQRGWQSSWEGSQSSRPDTWEATSWDTTWR
jgi:hypothetical protein